MFGEDPAVAAAAYIPNAEIEAEPCTNCGATWQRCLQGWDENNFHPAGVCCRVCHVTDTHKADAARRAEAARRRAATPTPSGDALDRAAKLLDRHCLRPGLMAELVEDIAKLIDTADAAADKDAPQQIGGHTVTHWYSTAERRMCQINDLDGVVRRRNARIADLEQALEDQVDAIAKRNASIAELEGELEELRRDGGAHLFAAIDRTNTAEAELAIAERKLEIADRQRREFARAAHRAVQERDAARQRTAQLESAGCAGLTTEQLLAELGRRING